VLENHLFVKVNCVYQRGNILATVGDQKVMAFLVSVIF